MVSVRAAAARGATTRDLSSSVRFASTFPLSATGTVSITLNTTIPLLVGNILTWQMAGITGEAATKDVPRWGRITWKPTEQTLELVAVTEQHSTARRKPKQRIENDMIRCRAVHFCASFLFWSCVDSVVCVSFLFFVVCSVFCWFLFNSCSSFSVSSVQSVVE